MLEVLLATTLLVGLTGGLFAMYRQQQASFGAILSERQGVRLAAGVADRIVDGLAAAEAVTLAGTSSITYRLRDGGLHVFRLADGDASDPLARAMLFDGMPICQPRLIRNHNPSHASRGLFPQTYLDSTGAPTAGSVPIFSYFDSRGARLAEPVFDPSLIARVGVYLVIHGRLEAPKRYVRTSVALRNRP